MNEVGDSCILFEDFVIVVVDEFEVFKYIGE